MSADVLAVLAKPSEGRDRRKHERKTSLLPAVLVTDAGSFDCRVHNLSIGGARVESTAKVSPGQPVVLIVGSNPARGGSIVWSGDGCLGVQFSKLKEVAPMDRAASASAAPVEPQEQSREQPTTFVEFKRVQGAAIFVNPAQVLYVTAHGDGKYCDIHFGKDLHVTVHGDCKRICNQLARQ